MSRARHIPPPTSQLPNPHSRLFLPAVQLIQKVPRRTRTVRASMTILLPPTKSEAMLSSRRWKAGVWSVGCLLACLAGSSRAAAQSTGELWGDFTIDWLQSQPSDLGGRRRAQEIDHSAGGHVWVGEPGRYSICPVHAREVGRRTCRSRLGLQAERRRRDRDQSARRTLLSYPLATAGGSWGATRRRTRETAAASPGALQSPASRVQDKDPLNGGATTTTWRLRDRQEISLSVQSQEVDRGRRRVRDRRRRAVRAAR